MSDPRDPILRVVPQHRDINSNGAIPDPIVQ